MATRSNRIKRERIDPADKLAKTIGLPDSQMGRGRLRLVDVQNHTDDDQRVMNRSGKRQTVFRKTKIDKLFDAKIISKREALACEWYAATHAARYDTTGVTARYGESSGGGCTNFDHLPKTREQQDAFHHFADARASICPIARPLFERVVLHGRPLGKLAITFRITAQRLLAHIEGKVAL
jgi:hypothetical protein